MAPAAPIRRRVLALIIGLLWAAATPADAAERPKHLFLLIGQSNMAGRGAVEAEDRRPHPRVFSFSEQREWVPAVAPLHFDKPKVVGVGLGRSFGIAYAEDHQGVDVGLIPCAVGGSPIDSWAPGAEYAALKVHPYDDALARARAALRDGELKGILWHQGESDARPGLSEGYAEKLSALIARLRADLDAEGAPILIGQLGRFPDKPWDEHKTRVDAAHRAAAAADGRVGFVPSDGLTPKRDGVHFDSASLREFGRRYYAAWKTIAAAEAGPAEPPVQQRFENGRAAVMEEFSDPSAWVQEDLWIETPNDSDRDGEADRLHVAVTRPRQTDAGLTVPAVVFMSPYYGRTGPLLKEHMWAMRQEFGDPPPDRLRMPHRTARVDRPLLSRRHLTDWVPRGYAVVHASAPGTGLSSGCPTVGGQNEYDAPKAVVDWLCGRAEGFTAAEGGEPVVADWCTGKVGMSGTSYNGTFALAGALTGVEGLEVVVPVAPNTSYYHYYRTNGLIRHPLGYSGEEIDVLGEMILAADEDSWDACDAVQADLFSAAHLARDTGDWNDFWLSRDMLPRMENCRAAILMSHAFNDWNVVPEHSVRIYERAKELGIPAAIYMHQGGHGGPPPVELTNLWFTHFLHGVENDWDEGGRAWIVRAGDDRLKPTRYADYPNPDAAPVRMALSPGAPRAGGLAVAGGTPPEAPPATAAETFTDNFSFDSDALAAAEWTDHRLLYATAPLTAPVHLSGTPRVSVTLSCDRPAANLSAYLVALPWEDGRGTPLTDNLITRGWADPQNHAALPDGAPTAGEPLDPRRKYTVTFDLQPDDQIVPAGRRIGLMLFSTDKQFTVLPDPGTRITVYTAETHLTLPVVGGAETLKTAVTPPAVTPPAATPPSGG